MARAVPKITLSASRDIPFNKLVPSHANVRRLKAGTVYPILLRLADRGLVETTWEQDAPRGRPARHLYRLSVEGVKYLAALHESRGPDGAPPAAGVGAAFSPNL